MQFLIWLEQTPLSVWIRESTSLWAFPFILFLHTLGLAFVGGIGVAFNVWILGFGAKQPIAPMRQFFPIMWTGFTINLISGILLLAAYPAKALTNWVFYAKIALVVLAVVEIEWARKLAFTDADPRAPLERTPVLRILAIGSLLLWGGAVLTGRLLAYTHRMLMASEPF